MGSPKSSSQTDTGCRCAALRSRPGPVHTKADKTGNFPHQICGGAQSPAQSAAGQQNSEAFIEKRRMDLDEMVRALPQAHAPGQRCFSAKSLAVDKIAQRPIIWPISMPMQPRSSMAPTRIPLRRQKKNTVKIATMTPPSIARPPSRWRQLSQNQCRRFHSGTDRDKKSHNTAARR